MTQPFKFRWDPTTQMVHFVLSKTKKTDKEIIEFCSNDLWTVIAIRRCYCLLSRKWRERRNREENRIIHGYQIHLTKKLLASLAVLMIFYWIQSEEILTLSLPSSHTTKFECNSWILITHATFEIESCTYIWIRFDDKIKKDEQTCVI